MEIKTIFYDLGNVLVTVDGKKAVQALRERCEVSPRGIATCLIQSGYEQYELGLVSTEGFFRGLKDALGFDGTIEELGQICSDIFAPIPRNIELAYATSKRYQVGILSNTNQVHIDFISRQFDLLDFFTVRVYSYQEGVRKPDTRIYERAAQKYQAAPEQILFIDDLAENVQTARALNWKVIQYRPELDLKEAMSAHGVVTA
jgi:glucose-1-phosphatase